ncbi:tagaturonate reductase [Spirosoma liriopis]
MNMPAPTDLPTNQLWPDDPQTEQLPERVLQFGTGVLLRGLPDYLIDKANRQGVFNGRIVVVKSTSGGDVASFANQNNRYTLCIRGVANGQTIEENVRCSAISRVLVADHAWPEVLQVAASPDLQLILSNTTEVGIQYVAESIGQGAPNSFPGKLLAVLLARYQAFDGDREKGLIIVPTELIPKNGETLRAIVRQLAVYNGLEESFIDWLDSANTYCNSLVDRIVPGKPDQATHQALTDQLGYQDELLIVTESFKLWAIEGDERVKAKLSFAQADEGVVIQPDIDLFRELKLRLLNGTHTLSCGVAYLAECNTVREAMETPDVAAYVDRLMTAELTPGIPYAVDGQAAAQFSQQTQDRFRNPYIEHRWLAITVQYTAKMKLRNVPTLMQYYRTQAKPPLSMAFGFAAYLLFMRGERLDDGVCYGNRAGERYVIQDSEATYFANLWAQSSPEQVVAMVLRNKALWGENLAELPGFETAVSAYLLRFMEQGVSSTLAMHLNQQPAEAAIG